MILKGYGRDISSIFQLLGEHENDITKSIAFSFSRCDAFLLKFLEALSIDASNIDPNSFTITYQQEQDDGISDIEIVCPTIFHIIIEAKKGFNLPSLRQLNKYANDLQSCPEKDKYICTLSDSLNIVASSTFQKPINDIPIKHMTYESVIKCAESAKSELDHSQKRIIEELIKYLKEVVNMQDLHSNTVYVVPISGDSIVEHDKARTYHCPIGGGFLKAPTNYLGFRHKGKLQYINHVDAVETYFNEEGKPMFRFHLGPDIVPLKEVRTGLRYSRGTKFYCDIDLLLTCDTIVEAREKTEERHK